MLETLVVVGIVGLAAASIGKRIWSAASPRRGEDCNGEGPSCSGCGGGCGVQAPRQRELVRIRRRDGSEL